MPRYIDADALEDSLIERYCDICKGACCALCRAGYIFQEIKSAPAADVEPVRHGRWVKMTGMMPPEFTGHYSCSECDWFCKKHSIRETEFDFCPNCGCRMNVEGKDAEVH